MYRTFLKRFFDIVFSLLGLPFFLLLLGILAPIICLSDNGPVFYSAPRLGKDGRPFIMHKFRSMIVGAPDIRNGDGSTYNSAEDRRVTKIGRFLRNTSLDEAPQILNVLKGDMSIIGPRPDLPDALNLYSPEQKQKLKARPGMTGYNQAYFRNSIAMADRLNNDIFYTSHISLTLDLKILIKTIGCVFGRKNVYAKDGTGDEPSLKNGR